MYQFLARLRSDVDQVDVQPFISDAMLKAKYDRGRYPWSALLAAYCARISAMTARPDVDLLWIEKEALPWLPAWAERLTYRGRPYALDFDDAVFHNYDRHRLRWVRRLLGRRIDHLMAGARLVVAGNSYLAERARQAGAGWVEIAPTVVDIERYTPRARHEDSNLPKVVWIGSPSTAQYLASLAVPLARLRAELPFVLRVIGATPPAMAGVDVECAEWSAERENELLRECDVGVMPLFDTPWERGKCAYKLIQYMACALPTVASAVGANLDVTVESETGFLVSNDDEWVDRLRRLLRDPPLRQRMGQAGRLRVELGYSLQVMAPRIQGWLRRAAGVGSCAA
jgi:glycosyltransferase involved in cell wall biosynthesis